MTREWHEMTSPLVYGYGLAGGLHFPWHDNLDETIAYYGSIEPIVGQEIDYNANYWLTRSFPFDFSITSVSNDGIVGQIQLDRSYPGAVGILCDWSGQIINGGGNLLVRAAGTEWQTGTNFVFIAKPTTSDSDSHIFINPESAASQFPDYKEEADGPPNLTTLRSRTSLRVALEGNFDSGGTITFSGTVRLIVQKSLESIPVEGIGAKLYRAVGGMVDDVTPVDSSFRAYTVRRQRGIHTPDNNRFRVCLAGCSGTTDDDPTAVFLSEDGGDSWTQVGTIDEVGGKYQGCYVTESGLVYAFGKNFIGVSTWDNLMNGGDFDNRTGNMPNDTIKAIMGA